MSAPFVHLHLHSEYSLADSTIRIAELVKRCVALGQPAVALTDIDNLFATVKFYKAAEAAGLKPIIGADIHLADGNETPSRMTLLCRDRGGYLTLSRLLSRAWMEGHQVDGVVVRPQWLREAETNGGQQDGETWDHPTHLVVAGRGLGLRPFLPGSSVATTGGKPLS